MNRLAPWLLLGLAWLAWCAAGAAERAQPAPDDWPQWRGAARDGQAGPGKLADSWPAEGPPVVWRKDIGAGFSSPSVVGDALYVAYAKGDEETLFRLDATTGKEVWALSLGDNFEEEYGAGPRATPTVDGDLVFMTSSLGKVVAVDAASGRRRWAVDLHAGGGYGRGYASSPLVVGSLVVVQGAESGGPSIFALERRSGKVAWTAERGRAAASSPMLLTFAGEPQIVSAYAGGLVGLSPRDGRRLWQFPWRTHYGLNIATPLLLPADRVLISAGYDQGAAAVQVARRGIVWAAEPAWTNRKFRNHFSSSVLVGGEIYGFDNNFLACLDAATGEERWRARGYGKGSLIAADGKLLVLSDQGALALVRPDPKAHQELARASVLPGRSWTAPVMAAGFAYLRNHEQLVRLDLRAPAPAPARSR